jgi:hypothetical protein
MSARDEPGQPLLEPAVLADLQDAELDRETLDQLFFDLSQLAQLVEVRVKGAVDGYAAEAQPTLEKASTLLAEGFAVQLRYIYQGSEWIDTLLPLEGGARLIRVRPPWA